MTISTKKCTTKNLMIFNYKVITILIYNNCLDRLKTMYFDGINSLLLDKLNLMSLKNLMNTPGNYY